MTSRRALRTWPVTTRTGWWASSATTAAPHTGHYVSDVYSVGRDRWFHYDDRRVYCVEEADVLSEGYQRNGYIFFCLHKDLCSQVVSAKAAEPECSG